MNCMFNWKYTAVVNLASSASVQEQQQFLILQERKSTIFHERVVFVCCCWPAAVTQSRVSSGSLMA